MLGHCVKEPVSSGRPQVNAGALLNLVKGRGSAPVTLLCPGQASPPPFFRWVPLSPRFRSDFLR